LRVSKPAENKKDSKNFFKVASAWFLFTKAYPIIPLLTHSKLVTQSF
jgi:hypothetical protein